MSSALWHPRPPMCRSRGSRSPLQRGASH